MKKTDLENIYAGAEYFVRELAQGIYLIGCDIHFPGFQPGRELKAGLPTDNSYLIVGEEKALLLDSGAAVPGLRELAEKMAGVPVMMALTHGHVDHTFRICEFEEMRMHKADECLLHGAFGMPVLEDIPRTIHYLKAGDRIDLGNRMVEIYSLAGHTDGGLLYLDRNTRILFTGDVISRRVLYGTCNWVPVEAFAEELMKIRALDFERILSAHDRVFFKKDLIDRILEMLETVPEDCSEYYMPVVGASFLEYAAGKEEDMTYVSFSFPVSRKKEVLAAADKIRQDTESLQKQSRGTGFEENEGT